MNLLAFWSEATDGGKWVATAIAIPFLAGLGTWFAARMAEREKRNRDNYATAVETLVAWIEMPYRVRRRTSNDPATLTALADQAHDLQERMAFHETWLATDQPQLAGAYRRTRRAVAQPVGAAMDDAWRSAPISSPGDMNLSGWGPGPECQAALEELQISIAKRFGWRRRIPTSLRAPQQRDGGHIRTRVLVAGLVALAVVNFVVVVVAFATSWRVADVSVASVAELNSQAQTLLAAVGLVISSVLAWITGFYAWITRRLLDESQTDRHGRAEASKRSQAELLGGFITRSLAGSGMQVITMNLHNSSRLPVRAVKGVLVEATSRKPVESYKIYPVVTPGSVSQSVRLDQAVGELVLELQFDDDAGRTWRKYGPDEPLLCVEDPYDRQGLSAL